MDELEVIAKSKARSWWTQRVLAAAWVLGALLAAAVVAWAMLRVDAAVHASHAGTAPAPPSAGKSLQAHHPRPHIPILQEDWEKNAVVVVLGVFCLVGLATFYRLAVVHPRGIRRRAWPGALVAFGAWLAVSWAFGAYVGSLGRYTLYYGSVAAVAVLLVWLYLTSWSLLIGAELNAQLEGLRDDPSARSSSGRSVPAKRARRM